MTQIRRAVAEDLPGIVSIHQAVFRHFFLTRLGGDFLRRYYALALDYPAGIVLVSPWGGPVEGFACGFLDPAEFYRSMWRSRGAFAGPALSALIRHPSLAASVLRGLRRVQTPPASAHERSCELSSIAVAPEAGGRGLGKALVQAFLDQARSIEAQSVYLTTDADGNEPVNAFYRQAGFHNTRRFLQRRGRWMNEYVIGLSGAATD